MPVYISSTVDVDMTPVQLRLILAAGSFQARLRPRAPGPGLKRKGMGERN